MKLALNTFAALALTASTAFAAGAEGPAFDADDMAVNKTVGEAVTVLAPDFNSKRSGQETIDGSLRVNLFDGSERVDTTPGGAHFR